MAVETNITGKKLTIEQAAQYIGISAYYIRKAINQGQIAYHRYPTMNGKGRYFIRLEDIEAFDLACHVTPVKQRKF